MGEAWKELEVGLWEWCRVEFGGKGGMEIVRPCWGEIEVEVEAA